MNARPNPDELLARAQAEEARQKRGQLKIYIGAAAGVGKTYAMLEEAHRLKTTGVDVVVGYVEPHSRPETEQLSKGLESIPTRMVTYHGTTLREFDLDAALTRHPSLILLDELAHTNAEGLRHSKRWQDALELLDAGIDVNTTVNVQHVESLNDLVAQITGVIVRETVPDSVIEQADQVELIDLTPEELIQRLKQGKIYRPPQAEQALKSFFRPGNLTALRELALRQTAAQVNREVQDYRQEHHIENTWPTAELLLVGVGPGPNASRLARATHRLAQSLQAEWIAAFVDTGIRMSEEDRESVSQAMRLAEQLGARVATLNGVNVSDELVNYAFQKNVSKLVVGKPSRPRWQEFFSNSKISELARKSGQIDVYVIQGEEEEAVSIRHKLPERRSSLSQYALALGVFLLTTLIALVVDRAAFGEANVVMTYLLGVVVVAFYIGRGPALLMAVLSIVFFDVMFVNPRGTLAVSDTRYLITFAVMMVVGLAISTLAARVRQQALAARLRERRTSELYDMSREFASTPNVSALAQIAEKHIGNVFDSKAAVLLPGENGKIAPREQDHHTAEETTSLENEMGVAQWAFDHRQESGLGTATLAGATSIYMPLMTSQGTVGVVRILPNNASDSRLRDSEQRHLLETFVNQTALALERAKLDEEAQKASAQVETEKLRNSLLSSVSHDLRTPLATIKGAASGLVDSGASMDEPTRRELAESIYDESERLNRLVNNLLEMTRLQSGATRVKRDWQPIEEVIGAALERMEPQLRHREMQTSVPGDLPLAPFDGVLIEQVIINLLDNAAKYSPANQPIEIAASAMPGALGVMVSDRGPGLAPGDETRIFERFYRAENIGATTGAGLGLAICKGIVDAHGGKIWAQNRAGGGMTMTFTLPIIGQPPQVTRGENKTEG